jgi:hypothetical protein
MDMDVENDEPNVSTKGQGETEWVEMSMDIPGYRDDDALPVFLSNLLMEALLASGELQDRLWINRRFHWKLYIDVRLHACHSTLMLTSSGSAPLRSIVVSTPTALNHYTPGTALCTFTKNYLGRRSRSFIR